MSKIIKVTPKEREPTENERVKRKYTKRTNKKIKRYKSIIKPQHKFKNELARLAEIRTKQAEVETKEQKSQVLLNEIKALDLEIDGRRLTKYRDTEKYTTDQWFSAVVILYMEAKGITKKNMYSLLGLHSLTFDNYLSNEWPWKVEVMEKVCALLGLRFPDVLVRGRIERS